ncbi:MAG TPA: TraR/DksA C4-type zinc finger protein [Candidatus Methylomirabilis sp.]
MRTKTRSPKARATKNTKPAKKARPAQAAPTPAAHKPAKKAPRSVGKYEAIRQDLMRQRAALLTEAGAVLTTRHDQVAAPDVTDQAQLEVERNFVLRLKEREQKLLKKIDGAVERIDNGTFGICRGCANEIPLLRLQARPVTDLCIECKTKQEQDEKVRETG